MSNNEKPKPKLPIDISNQPLRPLKRPLSPYALDKRTYGEYMQELRKARDKEEAGQNKSADGSGQNNP